MKSTIRWNGNQSSSSETLDGISEESFESFVREWKKHACREIEFEDIRFVEGLVSRELFQRDKKLLSSRSGMMLKAAANGIIFRLRFGGISSPSWCRKMCKFREIPFPEITGKSTPVLSERPRCEQISRSCFFQYRKLSSRITFRWIYIDCYGQNFTRIIIISTGLIDVRFTCIMIVLRRNFVVVAERFTKKWIYSCKNK